MREEPAARPATMREGPVARPATVREGAGSPPTDSGTGGLPGPVAERFRPIRNLGHGGEAHLVMLVEDRETAEQRVVKLYRGAARQDGALLEALQGADPAHIVRIDSWGSEQDVYGTQVTWEIMEYIPAGSLATLLADRRPLPTGQVREVLAEVAAALKHLHSELRVGDRTGLAHRDVKPENVLIRRRKPLDLVLADFGLVAEAGVSQARTGLGGTPLYQAPETLLRRSRGTAQDWWSLGVMVVEMLTGRNPNAGLDAESPAPKVVFQHLITHEVDLSGVTDGRWRALCQGLLTRTPERRWGADEVSDWLAGRDPRVYAEESAAPKAVAPIEVGGERCYSLVTLATQMARNWADACRLFTVDDRRLELRAWLEDNFGGGDIPGDVVRTRASTTEEASRRVVRFVSYLAADRPPELDGRPADAAGLAALADAAARDGRARRLLGQVDAVVLGAFARHRCATPGHRRCNRPDGSGCQVLADAARRFSAAVEAVRERARHVAADGEIGPDGTAVANSLADETTARAAALRVLVDPDRVADLSRRLGWQPRARQRAWWARLADDVAGAPDQDTRLAGLLVALALVPAAKAQAAQQAGEARRRGWRTVGRTARALGGDLINLVLATLVLYLSTYAAGAAFQADRHPFNARTGLVYARQIAVFQQWVLIPGVILLACLLIRAATVRRAVGWAVTVALGAGAALAGLLYSRDVSWGRSPLVFGPPVQGKLTDLAGLWGPRYGTGGVVCGIAALVVASILWWRVDHTTRADRSPLRLLVKLGVVALVVAVYLGAHRGILPARTEIP